MGRRPTVAPEENVKQGPGGRTTTLTHRAFGQVTVHRTSGLANLFGSDIPHHNFMSMTISRAELDRHLNYDSIFGKEQLITVQFSEAQWITLLASPNSGSGVPCTLVRVAGESMPELPLRKQEDVFREEFQRKVEALSDIIKQAITDVEEELGASLSKTKKAKLLSRLDKLRMEVGSNLPFIANQFEEFMEEFVEKAKVEVAVHMDNETRRLGLQALATAQGTALGAGEPLALKSGEESHEG